MLALFLVALSSQLSALSCFAAEVKEPNVAGMFYPENPDVLSQMLEEMLEAVDPEPMGGKIFALISPHAGYEFSGQTAAYGYKLIKGQSYKTVIVIGPSHHYGFTGASVFPEGAFRTPLGDIEVDAEFTRQLLYKDTNIVFVPLAFAKEHSVEVQLPFLQAALTGFKIVPIVMGDCDLSFCQKLAGLLKEVIGKRQDVLVVASSDLDHAYDYDEVEMSDAMTLSYIKDMNAEGLYYGFREGKLKLCGGFPVVTTLMLARQLGHEKLSVLHHTNSAFVTGKKEKGAWTVGYASCAIDKEGEAAMLNEKQREHLLKLARGSLETYLKTGKKLEVAESDPLLLKEMGAFVTLSEHGRLRGCIGTIIGKQPLYLTIRDMAVEAGTGDPRFPQVELSEMKDIEMEVSVLSPLEKIDDPAVIEMGKHGVLVRKGYMSGVFLPQVATETGWSKEEFMSELCSQKAGLPRDAWKGKGTDIYIFTAEVFSEKK